MIFSSHRKLDPRRRYGSMEFRNKIKAASNYKRAFNPTSAFSLNIFNEHKTARAVKAICLVAFLAVFYYLVISPQFLISEVSIKGNHQVSAEQIQETLDAYGDKRLILIRKNNFFIMTHGRVNSFLTSTIPAIKEVVEYERSWPNKVTIEIREHTPGFVIESAGHYFLVDEEGVVVNEVDGPQKLLVARDQITENFVRGESLPNQKLAPFILSMNKSWASKINVPIEYVKFPGKGGNDVQFVTKNGWTALFDVTRPVSVQLSSLAVILSKQIPASQQSELAYVDLRLSKWAYYCFKASPCQQKEQVESTAGTETNVE